MAKNQLAYFCAECPRLEWAGLIFYKHVEGDFDDVDNLVFRIDRVLPMIIDSAGAFNFEMDGAKVLKYMMSHNLLEHRQGLVHSHHNMGTTFSSTDHEELEENGPNHAFYLSLVVNNRMEFTAWLAYPVKVSFEMHYDARKSHGENIIIKHECDVRTEQPQVSEEDVEMFEELWAEKKKQNGSMAKSSTGMHQSKMDFPANDLFSFYDAEENHPSYSRQLYLSFFTGEEGPRYQEPGYPENVIDNAMEVIEAELWGFKTSDPEYIEKGQEHYNILSVAYNSLTVGAFGVLSDNIKSTLNEYDLMYSQAVEMLRSVIDEFETRMNL